jgi:hypothetical protein
LRYYHEASTNSDYLFIAGGSLGVWRLSLCSGIFNPSPQAPQACPGTSYADLLVQAPVEGGNFQRKRCVDVDVIETPGTPPVPVLFALFAASSDATVSYSPTELRAYTWSGTTFTQIASYTFRNTTPPPPPASAPPVEVGTSLAVDPADHDSIYVGLGKGGIWRADLSGGALNATQIWSSTSCMATASPPIQHVRDLAIVRVNATSAQSVLYAALNYNELLEITDLGGSLQACTRTSLHSAGYAESIAAITNQGTNVTVLVVGQTAEGKGDDMRPPMSVNGAWVGLCLTGMEDPDDPVINPASSNAQFYQHDFGLGGGTLTWRTSIDYTAASYAELGSHSAILQAAPSGGDRLYHCSRNGGTELFDLDLASWTVTTSYPAFVGQAFRGQDSVVSSINPGVALFIQEGAGAIAASKEMVYLDTDPPYWITPVPQTEHSPCANGYPATVSCMSPAGPIEPGLYQGSILDEAHWLDPAAPTREYFLPGRKNWVRYWADTCLQIPDCSAPYDPCDVVGNPTWNLGKLTSSVTTLWRLISLQLPASGMVPNGPSMQAKTWLFALPDATATIPEETTPTEDRVQSLVDPRMSNGLPTVVYLSRSGSSHGVKVVRTSDIVATAASFCSQLGGVGGNGELLPQAMIPMRTALTHLEREPNGPVQCERITPCQDEIIPPHFSQKKHHLFNDHTELYKTRDLSGGLMYVLAIASGFPASYDPGLPTQFQPQGCAWVSHAGRPMLVLLDVTRTGDGVTFSDPTVLRVGLGSGQGNAFCVRTKVVGRRAFAYVGTVQGAIAVYDVSGSNLLPAPGQPYLPTTPILQPLQHEIELPRDPVDGLPTNCVDMEIVGDYLYVALARLGVGILSLADPANPQLLDIMDTPGLALGLSQRTVAAGTQLIVGDSRCGIRVYQ